MAIHAEFVLYRDRGSGICAKTDRRRAFFASANSASMITAGSVTGFALQLPMPEWTVRIARHSVFRTEYGQRHLVVVTGKTGVGAFSAVTHLCIFFSLRSRETGHQKDHEGCGNRNSPWSYLQKHVHAFVRASSIIN
jgi:hypothetical protein